MPAKDRNQMSPLPPSRLPPFNPSQKRSIYLPTGLKFGFWHFWDPRDPMHHTAPSVSVPITTLGAASCRPGNLRSGLHVATRAAYVKVRVPASMPFLQHNNTTQADRDTPHC